MGIFTRFEVASETETTRWINDDIKPIESERRSWGFWTFHNYCEQLFANTLSLTLTLTKKGILVNSNISTYLTGSSLIALGLTWWQAIICLQFILHIVILSLTEASDCCWESFGHRFHCSQLRTWCILSHRISRRQSLCLGDVRKQFRHMESYSSLTW